MKKLALSSLVALFAVSSANAATNYFVGGAAAISTNDNHTSVLGVAPEFGWKVDSNWDMGVGATFGYEHKDSDVIAEYGDDARAYTYGADVFARYKAAQFGGVKLLLKGSVGADFVTYTSEKNKAVDDETAWSLGAAVIPMITYDISESFTLYANLNFLGVYAGYNFKNDDLNINKSWGFGAGVDSGNVANTQDFQIGFNYNF